MTVTVGSLCSGYGGADLGLALGLGVPVRPAWHVEVSRHPAAILAHHFPGVPNHGDLTTLDHSKLTPVDWVTAGYPCPPFSVLSGRRQGVHDPRHIWPHVAHAIGYLRPRGVLLENVAGHLSLGFAGVLGDLAALGYNARWGVVRASDAGAPHSRARLFVVATETPRPPPRRRRHAAAVAAAHPGGRRLEKHAPAAPVQEAGPDPGDQPADHRGAWAPGVWGPYLPAIERWAAVMGRPAPSPTATWDGTAGQLSPRFVEWLMGLPAGWVTDVNLPATAQLAALGNGIVPQQAALAIRLLLGHDAPMDRTG